MYGLEVTSGDRGVAALVAVALSITACGGDDPMAPMAQETPVDQAASLEVTGALVTSQRIVFTSYRNGQYDIYKMDEAPLRSTG
jgi:hypothetical protein